MGQALGMRNMRWLQMLFRLLPAIGTAISFDFRLILVYRRIEVIADIGCRLISYSDCRDWQADRFYFLFRLRSFAQQVRPRFIW